MLHKKPVDARFKKLFEPGYIGKMWVKNRIVRSPMMVGLSTPDGCVMDRTVNHYREFARGGAGLIIVAYAYVDDDARDGKAWLQEVDEYRAQYWEAAV